MKNWPRIGFLILLVGLSGLNLLYVWKCPLDLCGDEAHYWEWARHIDICYYSKGPVVAYLIWLATHIGGDRPFAIRTVAVLLSAGSLLRNKWNGADAEKYITCLTGGGYDCPAAHLFLPQTTRHRRVRGSE